MIFGNNRELVEKAKLMNLRSSMENTWHKRVQEKIKKLRGQNYQSDSKCLTGNIAEKILEYAHDKKVDMIVLGSSNRLKGNFKNKSIGKCYSKGFRIGRLSRTYNSLNGSSVLSNPSICNIDFKNRLSIDLSCI